MTPMMSRVLLPEERFLRRYDTAFGAEPGAVPRFRRLVYGFWRRCGRRLPWRLTADPYAILVSEIMLQQTQAERVVEKYGSFMAAFPDFKSLARAPLAQVLARWKGLGYNRRAQALKAIAERVVSQYDGILPADVETLATFPGIGPATAGAMCAYAFDAPVVYIETNIRAVFLHFFFRGRHGVRDAELLPLVERTLDRRRPRDWYSALMDLGVAVKRVYGNPGRRSAHYTRQTPFEGSRRQARGRIISALVDHPEMGVAALARKAEVARETVEAVLPALVSDGLVVKRGRRYAIP